MPTAEAHIDTDRPGRYLVQFCRHAAAMGGARGPGTHLRGLLTRREVRVAADWTDTRGTVTFTPWGQCTLTADGTTLVLRVDAADEDGLRRIQDVIARDFDRFGRREHLTVIWQQPETPTVQAGPAP